MDYNKLHISDENKELEQDVLVELLRYIENGESFVFDAGAGAGKTYTLVETLKYLLINFGKELKLHNQKILCITFTNVAAKEISARLGNTSLVEISTIHNCIWDIISSHQKQLVDIHLNKLKTELAIIKNSLKNEKWAEQFIKLSDEEKTSLISIMLEKKALYYKYKGSNAAEFKGQFSDINNIFPSILKNVGNFKKIVDNIFKEQRYQNAVDKIISRDSKFNKVNYDARYNNDRLASMIISHVTLLEYAEKIVADNLILRQIIFDKYPYILVDEYQDTDPKVVSTLSKIHEYSKQAKHKCVIGYYGDKKQNIYDAGVGELFSQCHPGLTRVKKEFNRRSASEIIGVANKIRNDDLSQKTIYTDFPKGDVNFYNIEMSREQFIKEHIKKWNVTTENKLHCFELTNERVAEYSGFGSIYEFFKNSAWYKVGKRYEYLREHILSLDTTKLGIVQSLIFRILDFKNKVQIDNTMILDIIPSVKKNDALNIGHLRTLLEKLKNKNGTNLVDYIENLFIGYKMGDTYYDKCIEHIIGEKISSLDEFKLFILDQLYLLDTEASITDEKLIEYKEQIDIFLKIDINIFTLWYNFVIDKNEGSVVYHTYHGTKGREFENVIIFMNSKFGRDDQYFSRLFKVITSREEFESENDNKKVSEARNLFYVAVTRAVKNLSILYFDDLNGSEKDLINIFGEIKHDSVYLDM